MSWIDENHLTTARNNQYRRQVASQQQQRTKPMADASRQRQAYLGLVSSRQVEDDQDDLDERLGWRQAAQMLTSDDDDDDQEQQDLYFQQQQQQQQQRPSSRQEAPIRNKRLTERQQQEHNEHEDDNSSISFAQSGCHSIMSAWRMKAANKQARQASSGSRRPISVLSQASSNGKKSTASTAYTAGGRSSRFGLLPPAQNRIPLGPKSAQYLVTNSRRRRRANELVMSTLEARRQLLRQQGAASMLGSSSYLAGEPYLDLSGHEPAFRAQQQQQQARSHLDGLSLSPSPRPHFGVAGRMRSPSPHLVGGAQPATRQALSDLGGRRPSAAVQAQRDRALRAAAATTTTPRPPPLAKLDQNSSDLCSSNSSTGGSSSSSSADSSSQFSQLLGGELAPDCVLLEAGHLSSGGRQASIRPVVAVAVSAPDDEDGAGKLRRGALKRDSIRRLRLSRQQKEPAPSSSSISSSSADQQPSSRRPEQIKRGRSHQQQQQPLQVNRKSEIENNPFLNRHHFRSVSARQPKASPPSGQRTGQQSSLAGDGDDRPAAAGAPCSSAKRNSWLFSSARSGQRERRQPQQQQPQQSQSHQHQRRRLMMAGDDDNNGAAINVSGGGGKKVADGLINVQQQRTGSGGNKANKQRPIDVGPQRQLHSPIMSLFAGPANGRSLSRDEQDHEQQQQPPIRPDRPEKPEKVSKLVREGAKSSDDLKFDLMGNRRQYECSERWRYEKSTKSPDQREDGPIGPQTDEKGRKLELISQERLFSERIEVLRSSSISPPVAFADPKRGPARADSVGPRVAADLTRRASSEDRARANQRGPPPPGERPQVVPRRQTTSDGLAAGRSAPLARKLDFGAGQAEKLPKFEESADDEFRKRVDYLRKLAKSNLTNTGEQPASDRQRPATKALGSSWRPPVGTKPMSTNWQANPTTSRGVSCERPTPIGASAKPRAPPGSSLFDERANWNLGPLASSLDSASANRRCSPTPRTTNVELKKVADDHQLVAANRTTRPFQWGRSNSSLASSEVTSAQGSSIKPQSQPPIQRHQQQPLDRLQPQRTSQSNLSTLSSGSQHPEVMKLVVREKSAPKLNYAFVEQQQQQQQQQSAPKTVEQPPEARQTRVLEAPKAQPRPQLRSYPQAPPTSDTPTRAATTTTTTMSTTKTSLSSSQEIRLSYQKAPPARGSASSPRSPEFGPQATSSNDDSAIASSVSSPSLSYLLQAGAGAGVGTAATKTAPSDPATTTKQQPILASLKPQPPARPAAPSVQVADSPLQSILRRQQQQQQQQLLQEQTFEQQREARLRKFEQDCSAASSYGLDPVSVLFEPAEQNSQQLAEVSSPTRQQTQPSGSTRRVTFNDRASIRSFESISSMASNSTAVPNESALRQQLGSPDSMGSGSTSRLSGESPIDPSSSASHHHQGHQQQVGGAAIYAVRGDPELDSQGAGGSPVAQLTAAHHPALQQQAHYVLQQQRQFMIQPGRASSYADHPMRPLTNPMLQPHHHQVHQQPQQPFLRMTAPPSINMHQRQPLQQRPPVQYTARPISRLPMNPQLGASEANRPAAVEDPDEEPDYALRLRQAATSRVFASYVQPIQQPRRRPTMEELLSYQTEV